MLIVLTTVSSSDEGEALAEKIVAEKLASCVQVLPRMTSFYFWEGALQKEGEHILLIKTLEDKFAALERFVAENHSYEVPEIVAIEAKHVSAKYDEWLTTYLT